MNHRARQALAKQVVRGTPEGLKQPLRGLIGFDGGLQAIGRQEFCYLQMWRGRGRVERFQVTNLLFVDVWRPRPGGALLSNKLEFRPYIIELSCLNL